MLALHFNSLVAASFLLQQTRSVAVRLKPGHWEIFPQSALERRENTYKFIAARKGSPVYSYPIILLKWMLCEVWMFFVGNLCFQENQFLRITHQGEILRSMRLTVKVRSKTWNYSLQPNVWKTFWEVSGERAPLSICFMTPPIKTSALFLLLFCLSSSFRGINLSWLFYLPIFIWLRKSKVRYKKDFPGHLSDGPNTLSNG